MKNRLRMTPFGVWSTLCALTLVSMGSTGAAYRPLASIAVMLLAAAKSALVIVRYMEVGRAARHWQLLLQTWIFAVTAAVIIGYVLGLGPSVR